jgi:2-iminobutanoate/2-iminopropanoate deaminase
MNREVISTDRAPKAIGPYSQAVRLGCRGLVFCSGQISIDPESGAFVGEGDVRAQTRRVMENLRAVLEAAGTSFYRFVRTPLFLVDLGDFAAVNEVYGGFFTKDPPARATVQVAALPRGARVEIDAIAEAD